MIHCTDKTKLNFSFCILIIILITIFHVPVTHAGWEYSSPIPLGRNFNGIWGSADENIFIVGAYVEEGPAFSGQNDTVQRGFILNYDGYTWQEVTSIASDVSALYGIWGTSSTNIYATGQGVILKYSGRSWEAVTFSNPSLASLGSGEPINIYSIWGTSPTNIYAVGDSGLILHYNGVEWSRTSVGLNVSLHSVWGTSETNIFAVGSNGLIFRYNGRNWQKMDSITAEDLHAVWGNSEDDIFTVGSNGTILQYDGSDWTKMSSGTTNSLYGLWGTSESNVYAVGYQSIILRYNGTTWSEVSSGKTGAPSRLSWSLYTVWGTSRTNIFAAGRNDTILSYNGSAWQEMETGAIPGLYAINGSAVNTIYAAGQDGTLMYYNGSDWTLVYVGHRDDLYSVWNSGTDAIYTVGEGGTVSIFKNNKWDHFNFVIVQVCLVYNPNTGEYDSRIIETIVSRDHFAIWGSGSSIFIAGEYFSVDSCTPGLVEIYSIFSSTDNGTNWIENQTETDFDFYGLWGTSATNVFSAGEYGTLFQYADGNWAQMSSANELPGTGIARSFYDIWGTSASDFFLVGEDGTILRYDGTEFSEMDSGTSDRLHGVWGSSSTDVFAVGMSGTILHYDGTAWSQMRSNTTIDLLDVWGTAADNVYAVGAGGAILHFDGVVENNPPSASFFVDPEVGGIETEYLFDASGSSDIEDNTGELKVRWDFESDDSWDTDLSTTKTAAHTYIDFGVYAARLEVQDSQGLVDIASRLVTVSPECTADDDCDDGNDCSADSCLDNYCVYACNASAADDECCQDVVCLNDPICEAVEPEPEPEPEPGDNDTEPEPEPEPEPGNTPPSAFFTISPTSGSIDTEFTFDASESSDNQDFSDNLLVRWDWEGDGTWDSEYSTEKTATHQYTATGTYMVVLQVRDSGGLTDRRSRFITISEQLCPARLLLPPDDPALETLKLFRDQKLSSDALGTVLVKCYYKLSRTVTKLLKNHPFLRRRTAGLLRASMPYFEKHIQHSHSEKVIVINGERHAN